MMYLLTCDSCNGEYCETVHFSLHSSIETAKEAFSRLLNSEHLRGEDAPNQWEVDPDGKSEEFRTGNWGFVSWKIRYLKTDPVEYRTKTTLKCRKCLKSQGFEHLPQQDILWEAFDFEEEHMECAKELKIESRKDLFEETKEPILRRLV